MAYSCKILADSMSPADIRLTTVEITFPRFILAEVNTHRMLSRNSASSRAIPIHKSISAVRQDLFLPTQFGKNQPGMSSEVDLNPQETDKAAAVWYVAAARAIENAEALADLEVHKALGNRILAPYKWHTAIITATDWNNFFALRTDKNAQPEFQKIARMAQEAMWESNPDYLSPGEWHLPLVTFQEVMGDWNGLDDKPYTPDWDYWAKVSIGRCARVSYLTHDGKRDPDADVELHDKLMTNGHLSPFEHVATPFNLNEWGVIYELQNYVNMHMMGETISIQEALRLKHQVEYDGNFHGWHQRRKALPFEHDFSLVPG